MLIEAVVENGQVQFLQPVTFVHDFFSVKVDIPDKEIVLRDSSVRAPISEDERFMMSMSRERFDYTEWRRHGLPDYPLDELARLANIEAKKH